MSLAVIKSRAKLGIEAPIVSVEVHLLMVVRPLTLLAYPKPL